MSKKERKQSKQNEKLNLLAELAEVIAEETEKVLLKEGELDEHWDLDVDKIVVEEEVLMSDEVYQVLEKIFTLRYKELKDKVTYYMRQGEADERDKRRTDRAIDRSLTNSDLRGIRNLDS